MFNPSTYSSLCLVLRSTFTTIVINIYLVSGTHLFEKCKFYFIQLCMQMKKKVFGSIKGE